MHMNKDKGEFKFKLETVDSIPEATRTSTAKYDEILEQFQKMPMKNGVKRARINVENRKPNTVATALRRYIDGKGIEGIEVLERKVGNDNAVFLESKKGK